MRENDRCHLTPKRWTKFCPATVLADKEIVSIYRNIRSLINMQSCQFSCNLMLHRMSLVGLIHIPMLVGALNSTIVFLF